MKEKKTESTVQEVLTFNPSITVQESHIEMIRAIRSQLFFLESFFSQNHGDMIPWKEVKYHLHGQVVHTRAMVEALFDNLEPEESLACSDNNPRVDPGGMMNSNGESR